MAKQKVGEARFSLILRGESLQVESIEQALALKASRVIRRGEVLNRIPLIEAAQDEWIHSIELVTPEGVDEGWNALLSHLEARRDAVQALKAQCEVSLRLYIQSDYAQMAYSLEADTLRKLVSLELPLSVSSLSWGEYGL